MTGPHSDGRLIDAVYQQDTARVAALLREGASPATAAADGATPLYLAAVSGAADIARLLLAAGAPADAESTAPGSEGSPLCAAACWGHDSAVGELLAHGADPDLREDDGKGFTALLWAASGGHADTVRLLLRAGADPDAGCAGRTPLMAAAEFGALAITRDLLHHGADPHRTDQEGRTALDIARAWSGEDVETHLRRQAHTAPGATSKVSRRPRPDGTERVRLTVTTSGNGAAEWERETGHAAIAELLTRHMSGTT